MSIKVHPRLKAILMKLFGWIPVPSAWRKLRNENLYAIAAEEIERSAYNNKYLLELILKKDTEHRNNKSQLVKIISAILAQYDNKIEISKDLCEYVVKHEDELSLKVIGLENGGLQLTLEPKKLEELNGD